MKKLIVLAIATASLLLLSSPSGGSTERDLPASIVEFYQNRTFVSLLSSDVEREQILDALICDGTLASDSSLDYCNQLPPQPNSERLENVRSRIVEINQHLLNTGYSALIVPSYLPGSGSMIRRSDSNVVVLPSSADALPAGFFWPEPEVWQGEDALTVCVQTFPISAEVQARAIADYESPDREEFAFSMAESAESIEYHQWILMNNQWMKINSETHSTEPLP